MGWIQRNLSRTRAYGPDGNMVNESELSLRAIREFVGNAPIHRDLGPNTLGTGKSIQIRLLPDRLIIQSLVCLQGVSIDQLYSETNSQAAVNKTLYEIPKKLSTKDGAPVIKGEGGGIREVLRSCKEYNLAKPVPIDKGAEFMAILFRPAKTNLASLNHAASNLSKLTVLTSNAHAVLETMAQLDPVSVSQLATALALTKAQVKHALSQLQKAAPLTMLGKQGQMNTRYFLSPTNTL